MTGIARMDSEQVRSLDPDSAHTDRQVSQNHRAVIVAAAWKAQRAGLAASRIAQLFC